MKIGDFIKITPENPVLWTGMKGASAESRKKANKMLKQVQHDMTVRFWSFCHPEPGPELASGSNGFGISFLGLGISLLKPRPVGGVLYYIKKLFLKMDVNSLLFSKLSEQ